MGEEAEWLRDKLCKLKELIHEEQTLNLQVLVNLGCMLSIIRVPFPSIIMLLGELWLGMK